MLKPTIKKTGYLNVILSKNGRIKYYPVHRLIAKTFIDNPLEKKQVNHINGNKKDNRVENLEWCTQKENMQHSYWVLKNRLKPVLQYDDNNNLLNEFNSIKTASIKTNTRDTSIIRCIQGKLKHANGFVWKYKIKEEIL